MRATTITRILRAKISSRKKRQAIKVVKAFEDPSTERGFPLGLKGYSHGNRYNKRWLRIGEAMSRATEQLDSGW